jgi:release factor glutamine methyltransferase
LCLIKKRSTKIPLQHITGKQEFMGLDFFVNEHTLIPRQDTEVLVETLIEEAKKYNEKRLNILDICTGSGCIGISIAHFFKESNVCAVDISEDALLVALKNKELNHVENINFLKSDLFSSLDNEKFDIIVSNPPYIRTMEIEKLMEEVKIHEPFIALDGKEDGLYFYREITKKSVKYLKDGSSLMYEIGFDQAKDVSDILVENGFKNIKVIKDLPGHDRVVIGVYNK